MKKRVLLSAIVTIALCLSLIAGSTFALFTSDDDIDITLNSGHVEITAGLTDPVLYSVQPDAAGEEFDENGKPYSYVQQPGNEFANGGTAAIDPTTGYIVLERVTPGDKITFNLTGVNDSNVRVQYRYKFECVEGYDLMSGFVTTVEGNKYASMAAYTSEWHNLDENSNIGTDVNNGAGIPLAIELPVSAGNIYKDLSATLKLTVEVVQMNADTSDTDEAVVKYITTAQSATELADKLASDEILHIFVRDNIAETVNVNFNLTDKTIDANGKSVHLNFTKDADGNPITLENVVVKNLNTKTINIATGVNGDLTVADSYFTSDTKLGSAGYNAFIAGRGDANDNLSMTVENCIFDAQGVIDYGVYFMNIANLTIRDCKINNTKSWAIQGNGTLGNFVISGNTFTGCKGVLKGAIRGGAGTGSLSGNLTFANNKLVNCVPKEHTTNGTPVYMNLSPVNGTITFTNNTMDDVVITKEDMGMLG